MIDLDEIENAARKPWYCRSKQEDNLLSPEILVELVTSLRQAEKDAARYRWLRDESYQAEGVSPACFVISDGELAVDGNGYHGMLVTDGLDSAVDEAMQ